MSILSWGELAEGCEGDLSIARCIHGVMVFGRRDRIMVALLQSSIGYLTVNDS